MLRKLVNRTSSKDNFKAYLSGGILMIMLVCVALSLLDLFVCALGAIVLLVVSKCATPDSVKKAVRLNVVLTIVGAFGLGNAIGKHGIAQLLSFSWKQAM
jgi:di/tricarboxylate transporter